MFIHWVQYSDEPLAQELNAHLFNIPEENLQPDEVGKVDESYWTSHVPPQYHKHGVVFSKSALERMPV
jgi:hypothetical protein